MHPLFKARAFHFRAQEVIAWSGLAVSLGSLFYIFYGHGRAPSAGARGARPGRAAARARRVPADSLSLPFP